MSGPQMIAGVVEVGFNERTGEDYFILRHVPGFEFRLREEDLGRVEVGDTVCVEIVTDIYPWNGDVSQLTEADRTQYRLVRVSKGGNPAFQG